MVKVGVFGRIPGQLSCLESAVVLPLEQLVEAMKVSFSGLLVYNAGLKESDGT